MGIAAGTRPPQICPPAYAGSRSEAPSCRQRGWARGALLPHASPAVTLGKAFSPHVILQIINGSACSTAAATSFGVDNMVTGHRCRVTYGGAGGCGSLPGPAFPAPSLHVLPGKGWLGEIPKIGRCTQPWCALGCLERYLGHPEPRTVLDAARRGPRSIVTGAACGAGTVPAHNQAAPWDRGTLASPGPRGLLPSSEPMAQPDLLPVASPGSLCGTCHPTETSPSMSRRHQLHTFTDQLLLFRGFIQTCQVEMLFFFFFIPPRELAIEQLQLK